MAKAKAITTRGPTEYAMDQEIYYDAAGIRTIVNAQNWAVSERATCHISMCCGSDNWDDHPATSCTGDAGVSNAVGTLRAIATGSNVTVIDTDIWVNVDALNASFQVGAECHCTAASNTVRVSFVFTGGLGSATQTVDCRTVDNDLEVPANQSLAAVTAGGEWVRVQIQIQRVLGAATTNQLRTVRVEEITYAATSIPDPQNN